MRHCHPIILIVFVVIWNLSTFSSKVPQSGGHRSELQQLRLAKYGDGHGLAPTLADPALL